MEEKVVVTNVNNVKLVIDKHMIFKWKIEEKNEEKGRITIRFSRDDSVPYIEELRKLENEYGEYKIGNMLLAFFCPIISIILFTVLLVLFFVTGENFNFGLYFCALGIPALVALLAAVFVMFLRFRTINKINKEKPIKDAEYIDKVSKLK